MSRSPRFNIFFALFLSLWAGELFSQKNKTRFIDRIAVLEKQYDVSFSYNYTLFDGLEITIPEDCSNLDQCLIELQKVAPVTFESSETNQFLILPVRFDVTFTVSDDETNELIEILQVTVNRKTEFYLLPQNETYSIPDLFPTDSLHIHSRFYKTLKLEAAELFERTISLKMSPTAVYLDEVVIQDYLSSGVDAKLSDHSMEVNMRDLGLLAGETDGDILNVLKSFPGIRTPDGKPGSLNFRGSTPDQTLIYFDEIPIYHFGHFFGTISPYNPAAVSRIKIHRGTMPAKWGGRVGGLIDLRTDNEIVEKTKLDVMANTIYSGMNLNVPVKNDKLGLTLAARTNYPIDYLSPKLEAFRALNFQGSRVDPTRVGGPNRLDQFNVRFQDINGKLIYQINERNRATVSFMNIQNHFEYTLLSPNQNTREEQNSDLDNWGMTAKWEGNPGDKLSLNASFTLSSFSVFEQNAETTSNTPTSIDEVFNTIDDQRFSVGLGYRISDQSKLEFGYQFTSQETDLKERRVLNQPQTNQNEKAETHSLHLSTQHNIGSKLVTSLGIRSDYFTGLNKRFFDPRLSLSYLVSNAVFLKASGGISHQFISQQFKTDFDDFRLQNQFWSISNERVPVLEGIQGMVGLLYDKSGWLIDFELYQKRTDGIVRQETPQRNRSGSLLSKGADIFVKKRWAQFEAWAGYTISHTQTEFIRTLTAYFDQRHIMNLTFLYRKDRWNCALSWGYLSGMPVLIPEPEPGDPPLRVSFTGNFPAQHQLDLSVTYKFWQKEDQWRGVIGLSFLNLYDRQNIINIFQNNTQPDQPFRYAVGFAPNVNVRVSF